MLGYVPAARAGEPVAGGGGALAGAEPAVAVGGGSAGDGGGWDWDPVLVRAGRPSPGRVVIEGLRAVDEEDAREMIGLQLGYIEENGVTMARADDAAFFLERGLRDVGFKNARATWEILPDNTVLLTVDEGQRLHFGTLEVTGNDNLSHAAVRELLTKPTRERLRLPPAAEEIPFVTADLDEGVEAVAHLYSLMGYVDAEVALRGTDVRPAAGVVDVALTVREGMMHRVGAIGFPPAPDPAVTAVYDAVRTEFESKPFTPAVTANLADRIVRAAQEAGHYEAEVEVDPAPERRAPAAEDGEPRVFVDLAVRADWGRRYRLGTVEVVGTEVTRPGVIDRRFADLVGEPYSPAEVGEVVDELLETGAFAGVMVDPEPRPDGTIALGVEVDEAQSRRVGVYGGFGTYEGPILGAEYRNSNFLGLLRTFHAEAEYTGRGLSGEIGYIDPWWFGTDWELETSLFSRTQKHEGYDLLEVGAQLGVKRVFGEKERHTLSIFGRPTYGEVREFEIDEEFMGPLDYFIGLAGVGYTYDRRDHPQSPTRGLVFDVVLSGTPSVLGSDVAFGRATTRVAYFLPMGKTTLRMGARAGVIKPAGDDDLPIDLRFFSGGPRSVRSFRERDMGPRDPNGYPVGGEFYTTFNVEYDIPVAGPLSVAPFFDAGNLLPEAEDAGFDDMHYAAGLALILNSPIGPVRFEYGHNLNPGKNEPSGSWHVGFGFAF